LVARDTALPWSLGVSLMISPSIVSVAPEQYMRAVSSSGTRPTSCGYLDTKAFTMVMTSGFDV